MEIKRRHNTCWLSKVLKLAMAKLSDSPNFYSDITFLKGRERKRQPAQARSQRIFAECQ